MGRLEAARSYACAILAELGGDRAEVEALAEHVSLSERFRSEREECDEWCDDFEWGRHLKAAGIPAEVRPAFMVSECWDGTGPGRIHGEQIPLEARIIGVAEHWAALTAEDGLQLSHRDALADLGAASGRRYDPDVVDAARRVGSRIIETYPGGCRTA